MDIKNNLTKNINLDFLPLFLLSTFPLAIIFGNLLINFYLILFSISFLINYKNQKIIFKDIAFYLLIFFLISLIINVFFSLNPENSLPRVIKIIFIIFFIFEIKRLIQKYKESFMRYVYKSWVLIFLIVTIDIFFESFFGFNMIGNTSYMPGRISSFMGDELIIGAVYHGFMLFFLSYLIHKKKNSFLILSIIFVLIASFLIGERSNFIKLFLAVIIFSSLALNISYKMKIISSLSIIIILSIILNLSTSYKNRYFYQLRSLMTIDGYSNYMKQSQYGAHRNAALKILNENFIFGVGIKNFRFESAKKKYENKEYLQTKRRQATHPHQVHHEFLSETGMFGYLCFLIFIILSIYISFKNYLKFRELYQLSSIIFIITSLLPLLPSGSFLGTFASGIFWLNFAVMVGYNRIKKN